MTLLEHAEGVTQRNQSPLHKSETSPKKEKSMTIRFRKYKRQYESDSPVENVNAIKITEKNLWDIVAYINKNNRTALGNLNRPSIKLVQLNKSRTGKLTRGARVANVGDFIVRSEVYDGVADKKVYEFSRIKAADFEGFKLVK